MEPRAVPWLVPLHGCLAELPSAGWNGLQDFETDLQNLVQKYQVVPSLTGQERSRRLLRIRADLAGLGYMREADEAVPVVRPLMQFICGYYDLDLRDSVGLGHGQIIATHATSETRDRWIPRLLGGGLAGIALTERQGGSHIRATRTTSTASNGTWLVTGTKSWISRLHEADVFVVFFKDPSGQLTAAAVESQSAGLQRRPFRSSGLTGWSWGELVLDGVVVREADLIGPPGSGERLVREHFAAFRPLITATALGAAAAVLDTVTNELTKRQRRGDICRIRDNATIVLGRSHAAINAALLASITAHRLATATDELSTLWGCATKAFGIDIAYQAASELTLLTGALGFTMNSALAKARRDLNGLLYADGVHDSLYRSAGHFLSRRSAQAAKTSIKAGPSAADFAPDRLNSAPT